MWALQANRKPAGTVATHLVRAAAEGSRRPSPWGVLLASRPLLVFAGCGALFHMANGSMLGLLAQKLALQNVGLGIALTAACASSLAKRRVR